MKCNIDTFPIFRMKTIRIWDTKGDFKHRATCPDGVYMEEEEALELNKRDPLLKEWHEAW
jgi:hypothetical protein